MNLNRRRLIHASGLAAAAAVVAPFTPAAVAQPPGTRPGKPGAAVNGADLAAADNWSIFAGRKVGVITNPTGVLANFRSIVDDMADKGVDVGAVFGPEHGFRGTAQDGGSEGTSVDPRTGITVYDSYGAEVADYVGFYEASGVDTIGFDIQDVGARFYTYIWTCGAPCRRRPGPAPSLWSWTAPIPSAARRADRSSNPASSPEWDGWA
ncbi:exo-beta-N-acetylmuramidase NamZ domain-containing protein [Paenarthrobacter nicotinovorans]|uniref:exo-beta-N-acetylmuramidase NamZ domain-containing protein n=1 Tax=Paenarthrobacter nicotinovorans TaxID=29320 RepID=UPI003DA36B5E